MKTLITILVILPQFIFANSPEANWTDGDGLTWTFHAIQTRFIKGKARCAELGFRFPSEDEFYEAIQYGLFDENENESFASIIRKFDWFWMGNDSDGLTSHIVANRFEHRMRVLDHERHHVLCVRAPGRESQSLYTFLNK